MANIDKKNETNKKNKKKAKKNRLKNILRLFIHLFLFLLQAGMFCQLMLISGNEAFESYDANVIASVSIDKVILAILSLMFLSCLRNNSYSQVRKLFMMLNVITSGYVFLEALTKLYDGVDGIKEIIVAVYTLHLLCPIVLTWLFWNFIVELNSFDKWKLRYVLSAINFVTFFAIIMIVFNIKYEYYFTVNDFGVYARSDTFFVSLICPTVLLIISAVGILKQKMLFTDKLILLSYPLLPYVGMWFSYSKGSPDYTAVFSFCSVFFIYSNLLFHREQTIMKQKNELSESKVNSMLLQINPHFIYNTLGSVSSLCIDDPEQARKMLFKFSEYLRNNFGEMAKKTMIPFATEAEHLKTYLEIEKMRFPDIEVVFDLQFTDFEIPSLSVQPLAENAIKHGIMGREQGGKLIITSFKTDENYHVRVEDDGVGFTELKTDDGKNHIGISNVRSRLEMLCDGELIISSQKNVGTVSEIIIPRKK